MTSAFIHSALCRNRSGPDGSPTGFSCQHTMALSRIVCPHMSIIDNTASVQTFIKAGSFTTDGSTNALANHKEGRHRSEVSATRERFGGRGRICFT